MCMRALLLKGHKEEKDSLFVTQLFAGFESFTQLLQEECSLRTLSNLNNLYVVRGILDAETHRLMFETAMTGPHHYFGFLDPLKWHSLEICENTQNSYHVKIHTLEPHYNDQKCLPVPLQKTLYLDAASFEWQSHSLPTNKNQSLFASPGSFVYKGKDLQIPIIDNPQCFDWNMFKAQLIPPSTPFAFQQNLVTQHPDAQHRLRLITYYYGVDYFSQFVTRNTSDFVEKHDFVQLIHALDKDCGGYMILGRETPDHGIQLVQFKIPYGYTLLIDVGCIHGDARLTGLYLMGMTGNHTAMKSADTVFLPTADIVCKKQSTSSSFTPLITHSLQDKQTLLLQIAKLQRKILKNVSQKRPFASLFWQPFLCDAFNLFQNVYSLYNWNITFKKSIAPLGFFL